MKDTLSKLYCKIKGDGCLRTGHLFVLWLRVGGRVGECLSYWGGLLGRYLGVREGVAGGREEAG